MPTKPNIIVFITHDQGQFLGCYNTRLTPNSLKTPNLDKIAKEGIRFTNYFCTAPQCSPSRGSIQTSLYPHQNGLMGLTNKGWNLPASNKTLPMYLKDKGYTTHLIGLQHETNYPETLGYDTMNERVGYHKYTTKKLNNQFCEFLISHKKDKKPFYANFGIIEVHRPFSAFGDPVDVDKVIIPPFLPENEMIRKDFAEFYGLIHTVDATIGKIMDCLMDTKLYENTLFIFTTDHGAPFPRAKCTLYDPGIKTVLLMQHPYSSNFSGGKVYEQLLSNIDLLPTLVELSGGCVASHIEGQSFLSLLKGETDKIRNSIYAEKSYHDQYDPIRAIRTENYKYIFNFEPLNTQYLMPVDIDRSYSGQIMKELYNRPREQFELYDLQKDPHETRNLIQNLEYQDIAIDLKKQLLTWLKSTNDPILRGKIPPHG